MSAALEAQPVTVPRAYRDYSLEFKAEAIALVKSNGGNVLQTANALGIGESLLRAWLSTEGRYRKVCEVKIAELGDKLESNIHRLADSIADHDLSETPLNHKATALGILTDKMLLLRGQPTSIVATVERSELTVILQSALTTIDTDTDD